jgi:hypothetical protein
MCGKVLAHANGLRALPGEEECGFAHAPETKQESTRQVNAAKWIVQRSPSKTYWRPPNHLHRFLYKTTEKV